MVKHTLSGSHGSFSIDITQNPNTGEFSFIFGDLNGIQSFTINEPTRFIRISADDLQNDDWIPSGNVERRVDTVLTSNNVQRIDMTINPLSLFESYWLPFNAELGGRRGAVQVNVFFDMYRYQLLLNNLPLIEYHGFNWLISELDFTSTVLGHATTYYEQNSAANNREIIDIITGDGETHTGYGFNRPPENNGDDIRVNIPRPPSLSRLRSDHVVLYLADLDGSNIAEQKKEQVNRRYNVDIDIDRPVAQNKQHLIRREILYTDGSSHKTAYYKYDRTENKYFPDNTLGAGESGLIVSPDSPFGVYDRIQAFTPQIDFGRCV